MDTGVGAHGERTYNVELQLPNNLELPNFINSHLYSIWHTLKVSKYIYCNFVFINKFLLRDIFKISNSFVRFADNTLRKSNEVVHF